MSLISRYLEANGIPTVVIAAARDIVEQCGVPRMLFVDFPLGNPCGVPFDVQMQSTILDDALSLLEDATTPRTIRVAPQVWPGGQEWKDTIFTEEQPFLEGEAYDNWIAAKERSRKAKKGRGQ